MSDGLVIWTAILASATFTLALFTMFSIWAIRRSRFADISLKLLSKYGEEKMAEEVEHKAARKIRARQGRDRSIWFGLGMFGLVGWSVAIPTLIGLAIGIWIDMRWPSRFSWTLMGLIIGVALGCVNAWFWVKRESRRE